MKESKDALMVRNRRVAAARRRWAARYGISIRQPKSRAGQMSDGQRPNTAAQPPPGLTDAIYICCPFTRWPA